MREKINGAFALYGFLKSIAKSSMLQLRDSFFFAPRLSRFRLLVRKHFLCINRVIIVTAPGGGVTNNRL